MNRLALALAAASALVAAAPASAAITFDVSGAFTFNNAAAGTLTGSFETNDAITTVTAVNLVASASGGFVRTSYTSVAEIDNQQLPNTFRITFTNGSRQLQLTFTPALTQAGSSFGSNSFEAQQIQGGGNRLLTGTVVQAQGVAVPEPAAWGLMLLGFGLTGAGLRVRRRSVGFAAV